MAQLGHLKFLKIPAEFLRYNLSADDGCLWRSEYNQQNSLYDQSIGRAGHPTDHKRLKELSFETLFST